MKGFLDRTSDLTITTSTAMISWQQGNMDAVYDGAHPTRLTIPSGVTRVMIFFTLSYPSVTPSSRDYQYTLYKNGATTNRLYLQDNDLSSSVGICWGMFDVTPGDYFEVESRGYGASSHALTAQFCSFGFVTPSVMTGVTVAKLLSNTALSSTFSALSWATPTVDNLATFGGTDSFTVPSGVTAAIVSLQALRTALAGEGRFRLMKNGSAVRQYNSPNDKWAPGPPTFGIISVTAGDVLKVEAYGDSGSPGTLDSSLTVVAVEWYA